MVKEVARTDLKTPEFSYEKARAKMADGQLHSLSLTAGLVVNIISGLGVSFANPRSRLFKASAFGLITSLSILTICRFRESGIFPKTKTL
jgi:hypothetical protein